MGLTLHGYRYSVYQRIVLIALAEKGLSCARVEVDPFAGPPPAYLDLHPFGRVPTLVHDDFVVYETAAICRYLDEGFEGPPLQPATARARARMTQIVAALDSYAYWPLVRQVYAHDVFRRAGGGPVDEAVIEAGLTASAPVLAALDRLIGSPEAAAGEHWSLADGHLAAMIGFFAQSPRGADRLAAAPRLAAWWRKAACRPSVRASDAGLPSAA